MFSERISCLLLAVSGRYRVGLGGGHDADLASSISGRTRVVARDQRLSPLANIVMAWNTPGRPGYERPKTSPVLAGEGFSAIAVPLTELAGNTRQYWVSALFHLSRDGRF